MLNSGSPEDAAMLLLVKIRTSKNIASPRNEPQIDWF
jgi:hypothetical protein